MINKYAVDFTKPIPPRNFIIYGPYGHGKTYAVRSLGPIMKSMGKKALVLDIVAGYSNLAGCEDWLEIESYKGPPENAEQLWMDLAKRVNSLNDVCEYGAVILDDLSGWERLTMYRVLPIAGKSKGMKTGAAATEHTQRDPDQADYGQCINLLGEQLAAVTSIDAITIVNAHELLMADPNVENKMIGGPYVVGRKFPATIGQYFDEIYHTEVTGASANREPEFWWNTMPDSTFYARSRIVDKQGKRILDRKIKPDYYDIFKKGGFIQ